MSTRTSCRHCGNIILRRRDGMWLSDPMRDLSRGLRCTVSPDDQHAPASAEQGTDPEVLRLRARVAELEAELER
jgi:hypothetical protein